MAQVQVRVKMFDHPIEVDEAEIPNLRKQGLLVDEREALLARRDALTAELASVEQELAAGAPPAADPASTSETGTAPAAKTAKKGA